MLRRTAEPGIYKLGVRDGDIGRVTEFYLRRSVADHSISHRGNRRLAQPAAGPHFALCARSGQRRRPFYSGRLGKRTNREKPCLQIATGPSLGNRRRRVTGSSRVCSSVVSLPAQRLKPIPSREPITGEARDPTRLTLCQLCAHV